MNKTGATIFTYKIHGLIRRMVDLKDCNIGLPLILLSNLDHSYGPKYLIECFTQHTLLNVGKWKSIFLKWYFDDFTLKMSMTLLGTTQYLTLYIKVARSCKCWSCRLGRLAWLRRLEYSTECVIHDPKGPLLYYVNFSGVGGFIEMPSKMTIC